MIDHVVLFRSLGPAEDRTPEILRILTSLRSLVPGMCCLRAAPNAAPERYQRGYDVGLVIRFESREALDAYNSHPQHRAAVERLDALTDQETLIVLDIEC